MKTHSQIGYVNEIVDATLDVGYCGLIGSESPLIVHNELEGVLAAFEIVNVGKVVTAPVHGNLPTPTVEGASDVYLSASVLPAKHGGYGFITD